MKQIIAVCALAFISVASCGRRGGEPVLVALDQSIDSGAEIVSLAAPEGVLYAATGNAVYKVEGTHWTQLPLPREARNQALLRRSIRLADADGRLLAVLYDGGETRIWERLPLYWRMIGTTRGNLSEPGSRVENGRLLLYGLTNIKWFDSRSGEFSDVDATDDDEATTQPFTLANQLYLVRSVLGEPSLVLEPGTLKVVLTLPANVVAVATDSKAWFALPGTLASWDGTTLTYHREPLFRSLHEAAGVVYGENKVGLYRHNVEKGKDVWIHEFKPEAEITALLGTRDGIYAATSSGLWKRDSGGRWDKLPSAQAPVLDVAARGDELIIVTDADVISSKFGAMENPRSVLTWFRGRRATACRQAFVAGEKVYALCGVQPQLFERSGTAWKPTGRGADLVGTYMGGREDRIFVGTMRGVYELSGNTLLEIGRLGQTVNTLAVPGDDIVAGTPHGVFHWKGSAWTPVPELLNVSITALSNAGTTALYVGTESGQVWRYDRKTAKAELFSKSVASASVPAIRALWFRPGKTLPANEVVLAGNVDGLFWTNDGGNNWVPVDISNRGVNRIISTRRSGALRVATSAGLFAVTEAIPDPLQPRIAAWWTRATRDWSWLVIVALLVVVLVTLLVPNALSLRLVGVLPEKWRNVYYLSLTISGAARRRLLRGHKQWLRTKNVVPVVRGRTTLTEALKRYVDVPYRPTVADRRSSEAACDLLKHHRVVWVHGTAGRGKTLFAWKMVNELMPAGFTPFVVEGYAIGTSVVASLCSAVQRSGMPITTPILDALLSREPIAVILDGFSEVRLEYRDKVLDDVAEFLSKYEKVQMVITSRLPAPRRLEEFDCAQLELLPVTDGLESFVTRYLKKRKPEAKHLVAALEQTSLAADQLTPLMLVLITDAYERTGEVPASLTEIYLAFFDQLVREEATGLSPAGIKTALEELTRRTFLARNGERGFTEREAIQCFAEMREQLADGFDIKVSAETLLKTMISCGILIEVMRHLRYCHDSFESYVAARFLDDRFARRDFIPVQELIASRTGNVALSEVWRFLDELVAQSGPDASGQLRKLERDMRRRSPARPTSGAGGTLTDSVARSERPPEHSGVQGSQSA